MTGGVAATAVLVLCCVVFAVVYNLRKRKQPALNVDETRYDLIGLVSSFSLANHYLGNIQLCCLCNSLCNSYISPWGIIILYIGIGLTRMYVQRPRSLSEIIHAYYRYQVLSRTSVSKCIDNAPINSTAVVIDCK